MDIIAIITSFEIQTAILLLLLGVSIASIVITIHMLLAEAPHKHKLAFSCMSLVLWTLAVLSGWRMFIRLIKVPSIEKTIPVLNGTIDAQTPTITYEFKTPVDLASIAVNTYPAIEMDIKRHGYFGNLTSIGRKLTLTSKTTLPPDEHYMVYLSNIEGPFTRGYGGEHLLEVNTPNLDIMEIIPHDAETTIAPNQTFTVTLNKPVADEKEWRITSVPEHSFTIRKSDDLTLSVTPQTALAQATQYTMMILHTPIIHRLGNDEEIQTLAPTVKKVIHFTTVRPPLLAGIEPQGSGISPTTPIRIIFEEPMDRPTVADGFSINPNVTLVQVWDTEGKILTLTHAVFPKDTGYVLNLKKGIKTLVGGVMESDLTYQFHTAGAVGIAQINPANGATDVSDTTPITLTFDQEVPEKIADYVIIAPVITATTSAQGRTLVYFPKKPFTHETLYSITLKAGAHGIYGLPSTKDQTFSFTIAPQSLAVPVYKQQSPFTCNISAARMLLAYRGIEFTEQKLIDIIGSGGKRGSGNPDRGYIDDYGTYWDPILRAVNVYRPAHLITSGKLADIITEIKKGNPVMTWGQNGWSDPHDISWTSKDGTRIKAINGMHSAVVRGYTGSDTNPTQILLNDPWRGQYSITTKEFMRRWGYIGVAMVIE